MHTEELQLTELRGLTVDDVLSMVYFFIALLLLEKFGLLPITDFAGCSKWKWVMFGMLITAAIVSNVQYAYRRQLLRP